MNAPHPTSLSLTAGEVADVKSRGYRPRDHYEQNAALREVIDFEASWELRCDKPTLLRRIFKNLLEHDSFLLLRRYEECIDTREHVSSLRRESHTWTRQSMPNTVRMYKFRSANSTRDYRERVWALQFAFVIG